MLRLFSLLRLRAEILWLIIAILLCALTLLILLINLLLGGDEAARERRILQFDYFSAPAITEAENSRIVFLGDSLTHEAPWVELFNEKSRTPIVILNRGLSGDTTKQLYERIGSIIRLKPKQVFILIGINDLIQRSTPTDTLKRYESIVAILRETLPDTMIYIQSVLPVSDHWFNPDQQDIRGLNQELQALSKKYHATYIDLYSHFVNERGFIDETLSNDGIHLLSKGYAIWHEVLTPYIQVREIKHLN